MIKRASASSAQDEGCEMVTTTRWFIIVGSSWVVDGMQSQYDYVYEVTIDLQLKCPNFTKRHHLEYEKLNSPESDIDHAKVNNFEGCCESRM
jgi:hypothetical protein